MLPLGAVRVLVLARAMPGLGSVALLSRADIGRTPRDAVDLRDRLGARHLIVNADDLDAAARLNQAGFWRIAAPRQIADLPLLPSPDAMAARLDGKWRNRLRHGQSHALTIRRHPMPPEPRHWLFRAEARQARALGYRPLPPHLIAAMAHVNPGAAQIFTAYSRGERVAAMLFLRHGRSATYQIGWSTQEGRALSANPVLMWRAMVDLQAMGTDRLDLGAADAPGLARFKQGTGATLRSLGGTWLASAWLPRRTELQGSWQALPIPRRDC